MLVDESRAGRIALQPETESERDALAELHDSTSLTDHDDLISWFTLDVPEYPALDEDVDFGGLGEKALVLAWGDRG